MPVQSFVKLLCPDSIALIGASARRGSVGQVVLSNILSGGFGGRIYAVNPNRLSVEGVTWAASIDVLPAVPDLAVIVTPARDIVDIVNRLGKLGTKMAVVITAGITVGNGLRADMLAAAVSHGMRLIGPNCVGALMPHVRLNASFSSVPALPGHVAMISQSGALITAILDTAAQRGLGFSCIVSVGDMADTDLADLIDVFAADPGTTAILLYVEGISATAKFMSAARAAVKIKPLIAIKAGRNAAGARAALSHTGSLAGADDVYRCAFARAGIITVETLTELFDAAEVFAAPCSIGGNRLAIVTNGGGAGILAVDALGASGTVAQLSAATLARLDAVLPVDWSHGNPIDVIGDGRVDRYRAAVDITLHDEGVDAVLVMNCPTGLSPLAEIADTVAAAVVAARAAGSRKPVLACWLGETNRAAAQTAFAGARIPLFATPEEAVRSFELMVAAMAARHRLTMADAEPAVPDEARAAALAIIADARADGRTLLDEVESKHLLAAYGVPVVPTR